MGAVIVDPATKDVIAQAHTDSDHPTRHAIMVCIDNVAKRQGGGAWFNSDKRREKGLCSCLAVCSISQHHSIIA